MFKTILFGTLLSISAVAHVKPGTYTGKDQNGKACQFTVGQEWFENNQHHPLNERIPVLGIQFAGHALSEVIWNVGHPPVLNVEKGLVRFNHDLFSQIVATKFGGASVVLLKNPEETPEGHEPVGVIYIEDHYRDQTSSKKLTCTL